PGAGRLAYTDVGGNSLMTIGFANLEPVTDLVTASVLTVNGTNGDNAINYTAGTAPTALSAITFFDGTPAFSEEQQVSLPPGTGSGTFTLTFNGQTTAPIAFNASS